MSEDCHDSENMKLPVPSGNDLVQERLDTGDFRQAKKFIGMMKVVVVHTLKGQWYAFDPCSNEASRLFMLLPVGNYQVEIKVMPVEEYRHIVAVCDPVKHLHEQLEKNG